MNDEEIVEAIERGNIQIEDVALSLFSPLLIPLAIGVAGEVVKAISESKKK